MPIYSRVFCAVHGDVIWCSADAFNVTQSEIKVAKRYYPSHLNGKFDRSDVGDWLCVDVEVKRVGLFKKKIVGAYLEKTEINING